MARKPTFEQTLKLIGDDPATLVLAIQLLDRMAWNRNRKARRSKRKAA
jgi:hypothetical protein